MDKYRYVICIYGKKIIINTNKEIIIENIRNYYEDFILLKEDNSYIDFKFYILNDNDLYNNNKMQHLCKTKYYKENIHYIYFKELLISINTATRKIIILSKRITNDFLQDINRIILNVLYKLMEKDNIFFIEAGGIAINNKTVLLIGEKNIIKDILYSFLKLDYNYISTESIGIKKDFNNINIFNLPEKTKMRETFKDKIILNTFLKRIILFENDWKLKKNKFSKVNKQEFFQTLRTKHEKHCKKYIKYIDNIFNSNKIENIDYDDIYDNIEIIKYSYNKYDLQSIIEDINNVNIFRNL